MCATGNKQHAAACVRRACWITQIASGFCSVLTVDNHLAVYGISIYIVCAVAGIRTVA